MEISSTLKDYNLRVSLILFPLDSLIIHGSLKEPKLSYRIVLKPYKVRGLEQLLVDGIEFANLSLIQRPSGYYLQITCYVPKEKKEKSEKNYQTVGLDFGCENTLTGYIEETNKSFKLDYRCEQPENQIRVQRKLSRRRVRNFSNRSNKGLRLQRLNRKYYEHQSNQKKDKTNKIIHNLKSYGKVVLQDEMISNWQKSGHGKKISNGILGRLKNRLKSLPNVFVLDKSYPTSKFCFDCFSKNDELKVWDRTYKCPNCGSIMDRDVHAAKNMIAFYHLSELVPMEYRNPKRLKKFILELLGDIKKRVEINSSESIDDIIVSCIQELSGKHEATSLNSW